MVLLIILYHFTETAKCFIGLKDIKLIPSLKCESYYYSVHPSFSGWGKATQVPKPDYYLCSGSLVPNGTRKCENLR